MSATLLEHPSETPETLVACADCPALRRVERELGELRREVSELRCEVGYWKSRHADAVKRNEQLAEELRQAKGEIRKLRQGELHQADETRWLVFVLLDGKKGYGWWLWVVLGADTVIYLLDSSRGHEVPEAHFGPEGSLWSGRLAATMFSLFATLARWKINPRLWLLWYLESCATAGGKAPENIEPFLPWNLSDERRAGLAMRTTTPAADTS